MTTVIIIFVSSIVFGVDFIGNDANEVIEVTETELYMIFTLRQTRWPDGSKLQALYLPITSSQTQELALEHLGMPVSKFHKIVKHQAKRNKIDVVEYESQDSIYRAVLKNHSSIGYGDFGDAADVKLFAIID